VSTWCTACLSPGYSCYCRLQEDRKPLRNKYKGRLIHVSDFVNPESGRLFIEDEAGTILDAREIIYPGGSNGDPWWDCEQLIKQVTKTIAIFNTKFPEKQALFIFDNSSAHGSLRPDALKVFEMNKSDGGKQRTQHDTIIPNSNPDPRYRGRAQKMTLPDGSPKGLKRVLEERGFNVTKLRAKCAPVCPIDSQNCCMARLLSQQDDFQNQVSMLETLIKAAGHEIVFLPKFHCELNPIEMVRFAQQCMFCFILNSYSQYWGWVKYRYREEDKPKFEDAKVLAVRWLNACPTEVIQRFINRTWRIMDGYRKGLTGRALSWAVRKC
jgi:hypothetical protein